MNSRNKTLLIFGGKSTALEIAEVAFEFYNNKFNKIKFVIGDNEIKSDSNQIFDSELTNNLLTNNSKYIISFSNHNLRLKVEDWMKNLNLKSTNIIHPSAIISKSATIGNGNYIAANTVISSKATIGNHNIINFNSTVGHDAFLNDHIIVNPGVRISGNVQIGSRVLVGANSFIFQGKSIGQDTFIDALTHIDKNVDEKMICTSKKTSIFKRVIF